MQTNTGVSGPDTPLQDGETDLGNSYLCFLISLDEISIWVLIPWSTHCGNRNITYSIGAGRIKGLIPIKCLSTVSGIHSIKFSLFHSLLHKGPMNSIFQVRKQARKVKNI